MNSRRRLCSRGSFFLGDVDGATAGGDGGLWMNGTAQPHHGRAEDIARRRWGIPMTLTNPSRGANKLTDMYVGVGTISRIRTPNPNYPNLIPNYQNLNYPITISDRKLRNPNLIRVLTLSTRITRTLLKSNRLWPNPLTWHNNPIKNLIVFIYWLLFHLMCALMTICWSYFCISSTVLLVG